VVVSIIAVLIGLAFPVFQGAQNSAKNAAAKNDLTQIVAAVSAFYTEYGTYPSTYSPEMTFDGKNGNNNDKLFNELRGNQFATMNPRNIGFIAPPVAKDATKPKGGIGQNDGRWYDPWGQEYLVRLDTDYDRQVTNPYSKNAGFSGGKIDQGVIAWSLGKDGKGGSGDKASGDAKDDVISWQ
ncbi:MAG: type II secretion system protein, partial [Chthoniobacterales bacterium]